MSLKLKPRKITNIGYTYLISLPRVFTDYHNISKGDPVGLEISDDCDGRVLIVKPMKKIDELSSEKTEEKKII